VFCARCALARGGAGARARLRVLAQEVLHGVLVHLQRVHKVLRVAAHAQRVAAARLPVRGLQVA